MAGEASVSVPVLPTLLGSRAYGVLSCASDHETHGIFASTHVGVWHPNLISPLSIMPCAALCFLRLCSRKNTILQANNMVCAAVGCASRLVRLMCYCTHAGMLAPFAAGAAIILPAGGRFSATTFWRDAVEFGATFYTAVPTMHQARPCVFQCCVADGVAGCAAGSWRGSMTPCHIWLTQMKKHRVWPSPQ